MIYTSLISSIELLSYFFALVIIPLFLFSGIFFPFGDLPTAARWFGWFTPLYHGVELLRALLLTSSPATSIGHALWLLGFSALLFPLAINLFRRRLEV